MRRRVIATPRSAWADPADAFSELCRGEGPAFWLDSGVSATTGWSYLGVASRTVTASIADGTVTQWPSGIATPGTILDFLRAEQAVGAQDPAEPQLVAGPFQLGWVGWLGYELHAQTTRTGLARPSRHPDAALMFVESAWAFDHARRTVIHLALESAPTTPTRWLSSRRRRRIETLPPAATWAYPDPEYLTMIAACQRSIAAGDAYQLCLTTQVRVDAHPDPVDTYLRLRKLSPSHHGGFVRIGGVSLLSSSPEQFLTVSAPTSRSVGRVIESKPIKGTRRRGVTPDEDAALRDELLASDKERAENLMIVDLMRNDIGRVSEVGTVTVPSLLAVETYAQVHQLVSTVRGVLSEGLDPVDAVAACFPAGSMTGAPKRAAILLLDALEQRPRGIYSGAFGYFALDGRIELAMVIRSIILDAEGATIGTGGGITALSVPHEELEEVKVKAAALLRVLGATSHESLIW